MKLRQSISNKKGVALLLVLLIMVVVSILAVAVLTMFNANMATERMQEDAIRAEYIAMSGVDVTMGALLQDNQSLLNNYFNKANNITITPLNDTIDYDGGQVAIVVSSMVENDERWVLITSTATLDGSSVNRVVKMKFRVEYPQIQQWE